MGRAKGKPGGKEVGSTRQGADGRGFNVEKDRNSGDTLEDPHRVPRGDIPGGSPGDPLGELPGETTQGTPWGLSVGVPGGIPGGSPPASR